MAKLRLVICCTNNKRIWMNGYAEKCQQAVRGIRGVSWNLRSQPAALCYSRACVSLGTTAVGKLHGTVPLITPAPIRDRRSTMRCLSVSLSVRDLRNYTSDLRQFLWSWLGPNWRRSDMLCTSGLVDDVIFAHKPRLLDVAAQLKRSAHAALGLAINGAQ